MIAKPRGTCSVDDCAKPKRSSGVQYCDTHYFRMRRNGTTEGRPVYTNRICSVVGCDRETKSKGMCGLHETRVRRHGSPDVRISPDDRDLPTRDRHHSWTGDQASYRTVHDRLRAWRGAASGYDCVECGGPARHWSYDHSDPNERRSEQGPYSLDLDHYQARCVPCHKRGDLAALKAKESQQGFLVHSWDGGAA